MKQLFTLVFISFAFLGFAQNAVDYTGLWINEDSSQVVEIFNKADTFYGIIENLLPEGKLIYDVQNKDEELRNMPLKGLTVWSNFTLNDNGKLKGGRIYNFKNGNTYNGKMQIKDGDLHLTGYYGIFFFLGKTQKWTIYK